MLNLKPSEDIVPMSEFRNNLSDCAARARRSGRPLLLTQNGRASYVFMDLAAFEELRDKLDKMEAYEDMLVAEGEADRGEVVSLEDMLPLIIAAAAPSICFPVVFQALPTLLRFIL